MSHTSVADNLLKYIQNKESDKYKLEFARTRYQQHVYDEAVESLDKILSKTENNASALILRGNSFYDDGNIFDSEESYIKFIQNWSIKDAESRTHYYYILERLGMVYIERKSWKDAKVVFLRWTSENPTMNGWLNLGIAWLKLNSFNEAEDALTQANLLDTHNAKIWGYIWLLWLKYHNETRNDQAEFCLSRALKLKIEDDYLLEEIGDIYGEKHPDFSVAWYERCIQITDKRGEIYHKYGSILLSLKRNQRPKAIQLLKDAVNKIEGDQNKSHIALILQEALREEGRDQEAEEYAHYIQGASTASK